MPRIKLIIAFDGTAYVGWQYQPNGVSVQQRVEEALAQLTGQVHSLHASGRTDAGVHARGLVCHFDTERSLPLSAWREGVNSLLPDDIAVRRAEVVDSNFHARFSVSTKHYRYTLLRDPVRDPLHRRTSWQIPHPLDMPAMQRAAQTFLGEHDFRAFRTSGCAATNTIRRIVAVDFQEEAPLLHIDIQGSGFLKNMVRMMVGTLVQIGWGKRPDTSIHEMLTKPTAAAPALTAPAHGLCLIGVCYEDA